MHKSYLDSFFFVCASITSDFLREIELQREINEIGIKSSQLQFEHKMYLFYYSLD